MLCPSCRKLISVDEKRCPHCGALRPGLWGWGPALQKLFGAEPDLTLVLIGACIVLFLASLAIGFRPMSGNPLAILSPSSAALFRLGMTGGAEGFGSRWWTLITAIYLHGGALHILLNMMALRQLGREAQEVFGAARYFVLFTLAGAGGFLLSNVFSDSFSIGASGSILGLVGALFAHYRRRGGSMGAAMARQLLQWALVIFLIGIVSPGIVNNLAHAGGFAVGFLFGHRVPGSDQRPAGRHMQLLAVALLVSTVVAFALALLKPPVLLPR
jgi:rhomboid protease GluP